MKIVYLLLLTTASTVFANDVPRLAPLIPAVRESSMMGSASNVVKSLWNTYSMYTEMKQQRAVANLAKKRADERALIEKEAEIVKAEAREYAIRKLGAARPYPVAIPYHVRLLGAMPRLISRHSLKIAMVPVAIGSVLYNLPFNSWPAFLLPN